MSETPGGPGNPDIIDLNDPKYKITTPEDREAAGEAETIKEAVFTVPDSSASSQEEPDVSRMREMWRVVEEHAEDRWDKRPHTEDEMDAEWQADAEVASARWRSAGEAAGERVRRARANVAAATGAVGRAGARVEEKAGARWDARRAAEDARWAAVDAPGVEEADPQEVIDAQATADAYAKTFERTKVPLNSDGMAYLDILNPDEDLRRALYKKFGVDESERWPNGAHKKDLKPGKSETWETELDKSKTKVFKKPSLNPFENWDNIVGLPKRALKSVGERATSLTPSEGPLGREVRRFLRSSDGKTVIEESWIERQRGHKGKGKAGERVLSTTRLLYVEGGAYEKDKSGKLVASKVFRKYQERPRTVVKHGEARDITTAELPNTGPVLNAPSIDADNPAFDDIDDGDAGKELAITAENEVPLSAQLPDQRPDPLPATERPIDPDDWKDFQSAGDKDKPEAKADAHPKAIEAANFEPDAEFTQDVSTSPEPDIIDGEIIEETQGPVLAITREPHGSRGGGEIDETHKAEAIRVPPEQILYPPIERQEHTLPLKAPAFPETAGEGSRRGHRLATREQGPPGGNSIRSETAQERSNDEDPEFSEILLEAQQTRPEFNIPPTGQFTDTQVKILIAGARKPGQLEVVNRMIDERSAQSMRDATLFGARKGDDAEAQTPAKALIMAKQARQLKIVQRRAGELARYNPADPDGAYTDDAEAKRLGMGRIFGKENPVRGVDEHDDVIARAQRRSGSQVTESVNKSEKPTDRLMGESELEQALLDVQTRKEIYRIAEMAVRQGYLANASKETGARTPGQMVASLGTSESEHLYDLLRETDSDVASYEALRRHLMEYEAEPNSELARIKAGFAPEQAHKAGFVWTPEAVKSVLATNPDDSVRDSLSRQLVVGGHLEVAEVKEGESYDIEYAGEKVRLTAADEVGEAALDSMKAAKAGGSPVRVSAADDLVIPPPPDAQRSRKNSGSRKPQKPRRKG